MYKGRRIILIAPAYNEELKIDKVLTRIPSGIVDRVLVIDDGSTDRTAAVAAANGADVLSLGAVKGVGFALREGYKQASAGNFDIAVVIAGNNKDDPGEITRLLDPICDEDFDFVIGSRFLAAGRYGGDMPVYRRMATRLHPWLLGLMVGKKITESTNGFRSLKVDVLSDPRINLGQAWLDHYELEVYLLMKLLILGYRCAEVPVSKIYPPRQLGYTKMRPIVDWWKILKPIFLLGVGLRR